MISLQTNADDDQKNSLYVHVSQCTGLSGSRNENNIYKSQTPNQQNTK